MLSGLAVSDHHAAHHDDHHDDHHRHHESGSADAHGPHGLVVDLPVLTILSTSNLRVADAVAQMLAWESCEIAAQGGVGGAAPEVPSDSRPSDARSRSGAARILRANHALLI